MRSNASSSMRRTKMASYITELNGLDLMILKTSHGNLQNTYVVHAPQ